MSESKSINEIIFVFEKIQDIWYTKFNYIKCLQVSIDYKEDTDKNYLGDLFRYFYDTLKISLEYKKGKTFETIYKNQLALMQTIYIQQDFIRELLLVFKIFDNDEITKQFNSDTSYILNRTIRNDLFGHPIKKKRTKREYKLTQSVIYSSVDVNYINYNKYSYNNNDNNYLETENHLIKEVISNHKLFLSKYLNIILSMQIELLEELQKKLIDLGETLKEDKIKFFKDLFDIYPAFFDSFFEHPFIINELIEKGDSKERYRNYRNLIIKEYNEFCCNFNNDINNKKQSKYKNGKKSYFQINFIDDHINISINEIDKNYRKSLSSEEILIDLFKGSKNIFFLTNIQELKKRYSNNQQILDELINIETNHEDNIELDCSIEYIRQLISK